MGRYMRIWGASPGGQPLASSRSAALLPRELLEVPGMKLILKITAGIILAVILIAAGCAILVSEGADTEKDGLVRVEAPDRGCWSGAIGNATRDGCGNAEFQVSESIISANAQKMTEGNWELVLVLEVNGEEIDRAETTAEFGIVSVVSG